MNYVKANMAFYHDQVGSRAQNEVFEIKNNEVLSELEQKGFVTRANEEEAQEMEHRKILRQEVGQRQALTNDIVSMSQHIQNKEANEHTQNVSQMRQQASQSQAQAKQNSDVKNNARKANDK